MVTNFSKASEYFILVGIYFLYSCTSFFTKYASLQEFLSLPYLLGLAGTFAVMAVYALLWQQILKRIELTTAYMFKGTSLIFVLLFSALIFNETITVWNIVGASLIVGGIVWFAKA